MHLMSQGKVYPIVLKDEKDNLDLYYIPSLRYIADPNNNSYYKIVLPLSYLTKLLNLPYHTLYMKFLRKGGLLTEPTSREVFCLVACVYSHWDLNYFISRFPSDHPVLSEEYRFKNLFGNVTPGLLHDEFPWVDFSNPNIKLLYMPFLKVVQHEDEFYYVMEQLPWNVFGFEINIDEYFEIYNRLLVNKKTLSLIRKIKESYAKRLICRQANSIFLKGCYNYSYVPVFKVVDIETLIAFLKEEFTQRPSVWSIDEKDVIQCPSRLIKYQDELFCFNKDKIVKQLRKNLDLKIKIIKNINKEEAIACLK